MSLAGFAYTYDVGPQYDVRMCWLIILYAAKSHSIYEMAFATLKEET